MLVLVLAQLFKSINEIWFGDLLPERKLTEPEDWRGFLGLIDDSTALLVGAAVRTAFHGLAT